MVKRPTNELTGLFALTIAGLLVGVAIATDGPVSRATNGLGGLLWIGAAVWLLMVARRDDERYAVHFVTTTALGLALVMIVKPSDYVAAVAGFGVGGVALALLFPTRGREWALLLAALWLPLHIMVAIARVIGRAARDLPAPVRQDPPPTAALVPLAMVLAAWCGAVSVELIRERRSGARARWADESR